MNWRFLTTLALLAGTALLLRTRNSAETVLPHQPLESFPHSFGKWTSIDRPLTPDVLEVLGPGDFLVRDYSTPSSAAPVSLFIAYFPSQRSGDTIHSPKNCLPGAGWTPLRSDRITLNFPGHAPFQANRYLIAKGQSRALVLYWYWAHNRAVASEYWAKYYLVADSIRMRRTDGSLIRFATEILPGEKVDSAQTRLLALGGNVVPAIENYIPQ
ncbi:MAG TPA: EpsI family protein [Terriglobales bacterium]|nr:EpsI family protein [Terriglobales bacterium]